MQPTRRDLDFRLAPDKAANWHLWGTHVTTFFNTLSLFFPVGERFFIHSVRHYRDRITDPELQKAVTGFIGQEAMHGREHDEYNAHVAAAGLPIQDMEAQVSRLLENLKSTVSPSFQLSATVALEHLTAILADHLLHEPRAIEGSDPNYRDLWLWHALEETEHKAVAFDVYRELIGEKPSGYALRVGGFVVANLIFWTLFSRYYVQNLRAQNQHRNWRGWLRVLNFSFGTPGGLRRIVPDWLAYFRPGFHPWDHDNRDPLARLDEIAQRYAAAIKGPPAFAHGAAVAA